MKVTNQILQTFLNKVAPRVITNLKRMQRTDEGSFKHQWNYYVWSIYFWLNGTTETIL